MGLEHLMQAAVHAAGGAGAAVGPRYNAVRTVVAPTAGRVRHAASNSWLETRNTMLPLMAAARAGAREATTAAAKAKAKEEKRLEREQRMSRGRTGIVAGVLVAGAAAGAAAVVMVRRRRNASWEEFDPNAALEAVKSDTGDLVDKVRDSAKDVKDTAAEMPTNMAADISDTAYRPQP